MRSRVTWIAVLGLTLTVGLLSGLTGVLWLTTFRSLTDEELSRQLQQVTLAVQESPNDGRESALVTAVSAVPASNLLTVVGIGPTGEVLAVSSGPEQVAQALADDPEALTKAVSTEQAGGVKLGDTSLRYTAAPTPGGGRVFVLTSADDLRDRAVQKAVIGAGVGAMCVLAGAALTIWALNRATRPLVDLARQTAELDSNNLDQVAVPEQPSEIHELASQLNSLIDRLNDEQRRRNTFLATVSHEIRTPLSIARGHLEALERYGPATESETTDAITTATDEITRAGRMVESLLTLARAEEPGFVKTREVELADVADDLTLRLSGLDTSVTVSPPPQALVKVDTERLAQAVLNAVTNSVAHNPEPVRVRVNWAVEGDDLTVLVTDDGVGFPPDIPPGELVNAFRSHTPGTSGLGLAVIDAVVMGHGGNLTLTQSPQGGAQVAMRLPAVHTGPPEIQTAEHRR